MHLFSFILHLCVALVAYGKKVREVSQNSSTNEALLTESSEDMTKLVQFGRIEPNWTQCASNFTLVNDTCIQTIIETPVYICESPKSLENKRCSHYVKKIPHCRNPYSLVKSFCVTHTVEVPEITCPPEFQLIHDNKCIKQTNSPPIIACPSTALLRNDKCVETEFYTPQYVCAKNHTRTDQHCIYENVFDCTPPRPEDSATKSESSIVAPPSNSPLPMNVIHSAHHLRWTTVATSYASFSNKSPVHQYRLPSDPSYVEEFVVKKTCKRTIREPARALCNPGDFLEEVHCKHYKQVDPVKLPGKLKTNTVEAIYKCHPGYQLKEDYNQAECIATDQELPEYICPKGYSSTGDMCAAFSTPFITCPLQFTLNSDGFCQKVIKQSPYSLYTVTYRCREANCQPLMS